MKKNLRLLMMTLLCAVFGSVAAAEVTDVLTKELTGVTGTSYAEWSGLQVSKQNEISFNFIS